MFGTVERKLDAKNRIVLPSAFRDELGSRFYITAGFDGNAELRSIENFNKYLDDIENQNAFKKDVRNLRRFILGRAAEVVLDSQGRFLISKEMLNFLSIQKDIVFVGVGSFVELWAKEVYDSNADQFYGGSISELAEKLAI